jgi:Uma2 family endonuclease
MSTTSFSFQSALSPPLPIHRFSVEHYHRLGELGVLGPDDRVELLEGWIVKKMNQRPAHGYAVTVLDTWLQSQVSSQCIVRCQLPITLENSEPEPDLAVVRGELSHFRHKHPGGSDCRLVIEVSDTSLAKDNAKAAIYASAGVEEYWIVNLVNCEVVAMRQPDQNAATYQSSESYRIGDKLTIAIGDNELHAPLPQLLDD